MRASFHSTALGKPIDLDRYPVCEASAAIEVPCVDDPKASCIWVGDNEQEDKVFEYTADANGKLTPTKHFEIKLGNAEVGDIEALVQDETRPARHRLAQPQERLYEGHEA